MAESEGMAVPSAWPARQLRRQAAIASERAQTKHRFNVLEQAVENINAKIDKLLERSEIALTRKNTVKDDIVIPEQRLERLELLLCRMPLDSYEKLDEQMSSLPKLAPRTLPAVNVAVPVCDMTQDDGSDGQSTELEREVNESVGMKTSMSASTDDEDKKQNIVKSASEICHPVSRAGSAFATSPFVQEDTSLDFADSIDHLEKQGEERSIEEFADKLDALCPARDMYDRAYRDLVQSRTDNTKFDSLFPRRDQRARAKVRQLLGQLKVFAFSGHVAKIWNRCYSSGDPDLFCDESLRAYLRLVVEVLPVYGRLRCIDIGDVSKQVERAQKALDALSPVGD